MVPTPKIIGSAGVTGTGLLSELRPPPFPPVVAMRARAHLKLIVSAPPGAPVEAEGDRVSMVVSVSPARQRFRWLRRHQSAAALWATSLVLSALAVAAALHR